jgi:hypothetical protein
MFASAVTLALFAFVGWMLTAMVRRDAGKIAAALQGQSWTAAIPAGRPNVALRFSQRFPAQRPVRARPEWRAAA